MADRLHVAFLLFPDVTQLDLTGPAQFLSRVARVSYVAGSLDPVATEAGFSIVPTATYNGVGPVDILCVPGGMGISSVMQDKHAMDWVAQVGQEVSWVTSVCTGSLILGAAGLLRGYKATTHWAWHDHLALFGATPAKGRTVIDRNRITGGGVTAGIDFALTLIAQVYGEQVAKLLQLAHEYDPEPPFDCGSPDRADPTTRALHDRTIAQLSPSRDQDLRAAAQKLGFC